MKPGDKVTVFENPLTRTKPEGQAKLVKCLIEDNYWEVEFIEDLGETFQRWIYPS